MEYKARQTRNTVVVHGIRVVRGKVLLLIDAGVTDSAVA